MSLDHLAIMKAYPQVTTVDDTGLIIDSDGKNVVVEQSKIDAARVELDKLNYQSDRTLNGSTVYASFGEQLGMLYDDMVAGKLDTTGTWATHIKAVKDANPKP
jgi:hypothetical protein|tara:strand:+ start:442 stop:750 length:309 start_codon:yes stop_codon:yes gene_type:complete